MRPLLPFFSLLACLCLQTAAAESLKLIKEGSAADLTARGNTALHNRRYDTAIAHFQRALEIDQNYFYALYNLGLTYQERHPARHRHEFHCSRCTSLLHARATSAPNNAEVQNNLGIIAYNLQEFQLSAQLFQAAHEKATNKSHSAEYAYNRGTALEQLQQWQEAKLLMKLPLV